MIAAKKQLNKLREMVRYSKGLYELKEAQKHYEMALKQHRDDSALLADYRVLLALIKMEEES